MSKDASSSRITSRNAHSRNTQQDESNENEFQTKLISSFHFPLPRTPLNTIQDPSLYSHESDLDKPETTRPGRFSDNKKPDAFDRNGNAGGLNYATPRVSNRHGREPCSAQSTPARSGPRSTQSSKGKELSGYNSISRVFGGISNASSDFAAEVSHFELDEDPSFWADHNVQVLIRIRPLSAVERVSLGYGRCLKQESAQTLVWLGHPETRFTFDLIACETISQEKLFRAAGLPMVENCMSGYNSCMFAYGQTGSGKTHTMMGEINQVEGKLSEDCGITPRIFEYLFSRIRMEEESRKDEKLKFSCKCSFLEIYNEQITDLLEPSSTNLQLREDLKKGVYVENLTEYNVRTVNDVIKLLLQGAANRKIAATHMNGESSRSHSVFTCIIESWWEKDSMSHFRFARLNLVDLAGSERQKSSGAEGDRLKEAANINKSLSTLGLVIMSLVDLAHGKHRHVPYRDSRLTFLLQDSLGGNSKTTIIANVSPSICSAHETLSTLKFAQRAKLIQNNAKVNEDASGDVGALQRQIQQLKDQLSFLTRHHKLSRSLSCCVQSFEESRLTDYSEIHLLSEERRETDNCNIPSVKVEKMKCLQATLIGALRREKVAETALRKLEAEIDHINRFACQREEDVQRTKMMLRFREEKIKQLELLMNGSLPTENYLMEENKALREEIQLLQARIDKNPEVTRFALENIRLLEQLQSFQNFYEQGERETLLAEISELRDQFFEMHERISKFSSRYKNKDNDTAEELADCRNMDFKLMREVDELHGELGEFLNCSQAASDAVTDSFPKDPEEIRHTDKYSLVETISAQSDTADEMASYTQADDVAIQNKNDHNKNATLVIQPGDSQKELIEARLLIEEMEFEQDHLIKELHLLQEQNHVYMEILSKRDHVERPSVLKVGSDCLELENLEIQNKDLVMEGGENTKSKALQAKLDKLTEDLEEARLLNCQYQEVQESHLSHRHEVELVCEQVELETTRTILHLQEEVAALQLELNERLCCLTQENLRLSNTIAAKEEDMRKLCVEWERATLELTSFLVEGSKSLKDASGQIENIVCSFPQVNTWIGEHVERAARSCVDKEETILQLEKSLEDAQKMVMEMELKLNSLREATMALNEFPQSDNDQTTEEAIDLSMLLNEKINMVKVLESKLKFKDNHINEAEKCADAAFVVVKWLSDRLKVAHFNDNERDIDISNLVFATKMGCHKTSENKTDADALSVEDLEARVELGSLLLEFENAITACYRDVEVHITALQTDILKVSTTYLKLVKDLLKEVHKMRSKVMELKENHAGCQFSVVKLKSLEPLKSPNNENHLHMLHSIKDELAKMNDMLKIIKDSIDTKIRAHGFLLTDEYLAEAEGWSADNSTSGYSTSSSDISTESVVRKKWEDSSYSCCSNLSGKTTEKMLDLKFQKGLVFESESENKNLLRESCHNGTMTFYLKKELDMAFDAFNKLYVLLAAILNESGVVDYSYTQEMKEVFPSFGLRMEIAEASCQNTQKVIADDKINFASTFLSKCEEARSTMKEADYMLNALLKANENANQLNGMWKQASQELMMERSRLIEENEQLKSSLSLKEKENELLLDEIGHGQLQLGNSVSLLERCFLQMQREVEDRYKVLFSDVLHMGREMLCFICNSKSSLEDVCCEIMEKGFGLFVLSQCLVGEIIHKTQSFNVQPSLYPFRQQVCSIGQDDIMITDKKGIRDVDESELVTDLEEEGLGLSHDNLIYENLSLKKELERKEVLFKGLLFDFSLLQETASNRKDIKDETEKLILALGEVRHVLEMKTSQLDDLLVQHKKVEDNLLDTENALLMSNSNLEQAKETIDTLSDQNAEFRMLLKDLYLRKAEAEEQLEEQKEVVKRLEREIIRLTSAIDKELRSSIEGLEEDLRKVINERDQLREEVCTLNDKLEMAYALADENEAIAVEARQESEASKVYAEQKEEEVKILEHSVEELECTINVMEKKVHEMDEELQRHQLVRDSLELELQALRQRLSMVKNFPDIMDTENTTSVQNEDPVSRQLQSRLLELHEAHNHIRLLEKDIAEKDKEIKQCKEYISELLLHSEAQASQYQEKYKTLEVMVHEVKTNLSNSASTALTLDKSEKTSTRTRGSSSPFRCIAGLVQQMNLEKDQEMSVARLHIEELEAVLASSQKEVCMLNARLAAAESMTHDVIRDLLGVKLDMTNYANLVDQHQVQKLVEEAHKQTEELLEKEQEILKLRKQIDDLIEERDSCICEINKKVADMLAAQMTLEQLQERDQLLSAQSEMLKMDKTNLLRKVAELDEIVKTLLGAQSSQQWIEKALPKENGVLKLDNADLSERLAHSEKLLSLVNDELAQHRKSSSSHPRVKTYRHDFELKDRKLRR